VFDSIEDAEKAMGIMQGLDFFGKTLRISFAREQSHAILKREGMPLPVSNSAEKSQRFFDRLRLKHAKNNPDELMDWESESGASPVLMIEMEGRIDSAEEALASLLTLYPGFVELNLNPHSNSALAHFLSSEHAEGALPGLNGYSPEENCRLRVTFSRS
jgi:RNA recognition motif-containing protein